LFHADRAAAERARDRLASAWPGVELMEDCGEYEVFLPLRLPLDKEKGTPTELQRHFDAARAVVREVELGDAPRFRVRVTMSYGGDRAGAEAGRTHFVGVGLNAEIEERISGPGIDEVLEWQRPWLLAAGRTKELESL
jgi:hypothetical protein